MSKSFPAPEAAIARFWSKVAIAGPDECWLWQGMLNTSGYGAFTIGPDKFPASRFALQLQVKRALNSDEFACHHCDTPRCCNPAHLFVGSPRENTADAAKKGRLKRWNGERAGQNNPRSKLTARDVIEIRALAPTMPRAELAARFNTTRSNISNIALGFTWGSVSDV